MTDKRKKLPEHLGLRMKRAPATCILCLSKESDTVQMELEEEDLQMKIDKVFYFQVVRHQDSANAVCDICKENVEVFFEYAEQVYENQKKLEITILTLPEVADGTNQGLYVKPEDSSDVDEAEWMEGDSCRDIKQEADQSSNEDEIMVETYLETSFGIEESYDNTEEFDLDEREDYDRTDETDDDASTENKDVKDEHLPGVKPKRKYTTGQKRELPKCGKVMQEPTQKSEESSVEEFVLQHYKLSCDLCSEPLNNFTELQRHYKYIHNERAYMKCCNKKIFKRCWMIEHIQLHINPDTFHCEICNKSYSSSSVLREHTKEVHAPDENRQLKCETCQKSFVSKSHLHAHVLVAHGSVPCPECPKVLASQGSLKKHLVAMHGEGEQFVCDICAQVYRTKKCFDTHVQRHLGTRLQNKVQCTTCSVWFTDKNCLTKHIRRMHSASEVLLACELCDKQFRNQDALNSHMHRQHTESRYECPFCQKKFKRPHHMKEHVAIHHTGEDLYECDYCPERFNTKNKKYLHRKTVHPAEFEEERRKRYLKDA